MCPLTLSRPPLFLHLAPHCLHSPPTPLPVFNLSPPVVSPWDPGVTQVFCSRWSAASHLCCLCDAVICLRAGFVGLPARGQARWAPMMEIVLLAASFSQTLTGTLALLDREECLQPLVMSQRRKIYHLTPFDIVLVFLTVFNCCKLSYGRVSVFWSHDGSYSFIEVW